MKRRKGITGVVIKYIIAMVKEIGMKVICEGVETQEQAIFLRSVGCDMAQGYYYAKPMPLKDLKSSIWLCITRSIQRILCEKKKNSCCQQEFFFMSIFKLRDI